MGEDGRRVARTWSRSRRWPWSAAAWPPGCVDVTTDLAALDSEGFWAVVLPFSGAPVCARFADVRPARPWPGPPWQGPGPETWTHAASTGPRFEAGVERSAPPSPPATSTRSTSPAG